MCPSYNPCQVRESPDGANSSVLNGGRASVSSTIPPATPSSCNPVLPGAVDSDDSEAQKVGGRDGGSFPLPIVADDRSDRADRDKNEHSKPKLASSNPFPKKPSLIPRTRQETGKREADALLERDVMMEFVKLDESGCDKDRKLPAPNGRPVNGFTKKRPAKVKVRSTKRSRSLSNVSAKGSPGGKMTRSVERLPTLSAFDEERIVWMKAYEDDLALEEERRRRNRMIRTAANKALQVGNH